MESQSQYGTRDQSPHTIEETLRQSSEEYFRQLFGIDDLQLKDAATSDGGRKEHFASSTDYRKLYSELNAKAKDLIRENVYFRNKLKLSERKLLQIMRDRTYLLDRLLAYEMPINLSSTDSSSSETNTSEDDACVLSTKSKVRPKTHPGLKNHHSHTTNAPKKIKRQQ